MKIVRNLKQGDKLSAGQGCKSVISRVVTPADMPFTEDGIIPDIIFNPHSIPTRMLPGQLMESAFQLLALDMCDYIDATMFANASVNDLSELYKKHGIKDYGYVPMYNG